MKWQTRTAFAAIGLAGLLLAADLSRAQGTTSFKLTNGDWNAATNWTGGVVPTGSTAVNIGSATKSPATANISHGDNLACGVVYLPEYGGQTGAVNQTDGLLDMGGAMLSVAAYNGISYGTYTLSGGVLSNAATKIGGNGFGTLNLYGGTFFTSFSAGLGVGLAAGWSVGNTGQVIQTAGILDGRNNGLTIGRDGGVGVYQMSGGVLTNGGTIVIGMNAGAGVPLGTLFLSGSGTVYAATMNLGQGAGGTGRVVQSSGVCQLGTLNVGSPTAKGIGRYEISGGQLAVGPINIPASGPSSGLLMISSNASISTTNDLTLGAAWYATGTVQQAGGVLNLNGHQLMIGANMGTILAQYTMSGGVLSNAGNIYIPNGVQAGEVGLLALSSNAVVGMQSSASITVSSSSNCKGTMQVVGGNVAIGTFQNFTHQQSSSTLQLLFQSEGISKLPLSGTASLGGTLWLGINGGMALFRTNAFTFIQAGTVSGDFAAKTSSVFAAAKNGVTYVATLGTTQKVTAAVFSQSGTTAAFAPTNTGWLATAISTNRAASFNLLLNVSTTGSTPTSKLDDLVAYIGQGGLTAKRVGTAWNSFNIQLTLPTAPVGAVTNYFAWDLSPFDTNLLVGAVSVVLQSKGTAVFFR